MNTPVQGVIAMPFTLEDLIREAKREIELRERVYPRWIERKRLTPEKAALHMALMRAVLANLESQRAPMEPDGAATMPDYQA